MAGALRCSVWCLNAAKPKVTLISGKILEVYSLKYLKKCIYLFVIHIIFKVFFFWNMDSHWLTHFVYFVTNNDTSFLWLMTITSENTSKHDIKLHPSSQFMWTLKGLWWHSGFNKVPHTQIKIHSVKHKDGTATNFQFRNQLLRSITGLFSSLCRRVVLIKTLGKF